MVVLDQWKQGAGRPEAEERTMSDHQIRARSVIGEEGSHVSSSLTKSCSFLLIMGKDKETTVVLKSAEDVIRAQCGVKDVVSIARGGRCQCCS
ncbi:hypothetical protein PIB30_024791 [Stylosanthes scabra]|uniref:Uncharacterized protein n=1 Tax=Stylosanthes scabra TaxID=79078 RepID=A0ABU6V8V9_9FABA|nr:hypothetical protein [Stylosanthes scabra]